MEKIEFEAENKVQSENCCNSHVNDSETASVAYENPAWQLLEELQELRPYKITDFQKEYFIPDF